MSGLESSALFEQCKPPGLREIRGPKMAEMDFAG